jgi:hypothetical protein
MGAPAEKKEGVKPEAHSGGAPASSGGKKGAHAPIAGNCHAVGCKSPDKRFNFCEEHYEQFKFGLIKKTGEPVSDWDKKSEHYQAYKARKSAHKVA